MRFVLVQDNPENHEAKRLFKFLGLVPTFPSIIIYDYPNNERKYYKTLK